MAQCYEINKFHTTPAPVSPDADAPKCGKNNDYVYDDCTVKIKDCGEAIMEDTSDYKNIII